MIIDLYEMYGGEKPRTFFYYPHPEPQNIYIYSKTKYSIPQILDSIIKDIRNVFKDPELRNYLAFEVLDEILNFFLWILHPQEKTTPKFEHFSFKESFNHKLGLRYYRPNYSNPNPGEKRGVQEKLWLIGEELSPEVSEKIKSEFPSITQMDLQLIIWYLAEICDQFVFDPISHRPISGSYRDDLLDSIPPHPQPKLELIL